MRKWLKKNWLPLYLLMFSVFVLVQTQRHGYGGNHPWAAVGMYSACLALMIYVSLIERRPK